MLNPRLSLLPDYPFERLRALLNPLQPPADLEPIAVSLGEPQHAYPDFVGEVLAANSHLYHRYPPVAGTAEFKTAVTDWLNRRYGLPAGMVNADRHIVPLSGTREGLFMVAFVTTPEKKAGKQPLVLMPNPFYQCYAGAAIAAGAAPVFLPATRENNFLPDLEALEESTLTRTALFYLCSPANPQGTIADLDYLGKLLTLARRYDFTLVIDECYAEIYADAPPCGILQACAAENGTMDNVLAFHSLSKRSNVAGLRSGFAVGDEKLVKTFLRLRDYGGSPSPLPIYAAATALWQEESHVQQNRARYQNKITTAEHILGNRFGFYRPPGGFFLWLDVGDGEAVAAKLWQQAAVRALPGAYLTRAAPRQGINPAAQYLRVALVHDEAVNEEALRRIAATLEN